MAVDETIELDISSMPLVEQLSENEQQLCGTLQLTPAQYLEVKQALLHESYRRGYLNRGNNRQLLRVEVNQTEDAMDFFIKAGWSMNEDATHQVLAGSQATPAATVPSKPS